MPIYRVDVNPEVLVWARKRAGYSVEDAAAKLRIDGLTLRYWEEGADELAQPTLVQLRKMAKRYGLPLAALYFPVPPEIEDESPPDFRTLKRGQRREWSPELLSTFRRVQMQRTVAAELAEAVDELPGSIGLVLGAATDKIEDAGQEVRNWLRISIEEQLAWSSDYQALNTWIDAIERQGILVAQSRGVALREMRGFSIGGYPFPVIVLNGSDTPRAKIFTLIHELVHVLINGGGICNLLETRRTTATYEDTETFCNQVAGATLLPIDQLACDIAPLRVAKPIIWADGTLVHLANRYKVSREVVVRRLVDLGHATLDFYYDKLRQYAGQYEKNLERRRESRNGGPDSAVLKLRDIGRRYAADVLRAYARRDINAAELSEYLDTKVEQIPKIYSLLERSA